MNNEAAETTKVWNPEDIVKWMLKDSGQTAKMLVAMYRLQTSDEQSIERTEHKNGIGFSTAHAKKLTGIAKFYLRTHFLTNAQLFRVRQVLPKYRKQLAAIANGEL